MRNRIEIVNPRIASNVQVRFNQSFSEQNLRKNKCKAGHLECDPTIRTRCASVKLEQSAKYAHS